MSLRCCPLCQLIFGSPNELVWHIHNEHHCVTEDEGLALEASQAASLHLGPASVASLVRSNEAAALSVFMATGPGPGVSNIDAAWLRHLSRVAYRRMKEQLHPAVFSQMALRFSAVLKVAYRRPADHGLAVFVSSRQMAVYGLPIAPRPRVLLGTHFAVRDLVDALQCFPRYRVLVLGAHQPRVLEGWSGRLSEVHCGGKEREQDSARAADAALAERVSAGDDLPLVLVGPAHLLSWWEAHSHHASLLIGTVHTHHVSAPCELLARMTAPVVSAWRDAVGAVQVSAMAHAEQNGLVTWGLSPVWSALAEHSVENLWVRRDFFAAAVRQGSGWQLEPAVAPRVPNRTDDVVEELVRAAWASRSNVYFFEPGAFGSDEPVGAQLVAARGHLGAQGGGRPHVVDLRESAVAI